MTDFLQGVGFGQLGAGALVAIIVLLVLTGRLVTRQQLRDSQANCDQWRAAADNWQATAHEQGMAVANLIDGVQAANYALSQIQAGLERQEHQT